MNHRAICLRSLAFLCLALAFHSQSNAQQPQVVRLRDCWSKFPVGSWSRVRVTKQQQSDQKQTSPTRSRETLSTLMKVNQEGYELQLDVDVKVGDRVFDTPSQSLKRGRMRQVQGEPYRIKTQGSANLTIDGRKIPTTVYQIVYGEGETQRVSKMYYSPQVCPFVLRQESHRGTALANPPETKVEVIALDMPYQVLTNRKTVAYVKTTKRHAERLTVTYEVHCADVPGGLVAHSSITRDAEGKLLERSSLTLLAYGSQDNPTEAKQSWLRPSRRSRLACQWHGPSQRREQPVFFAAELP